MGTVATVVSLIIVRCQRCGAEIKQYGKQHRVYCSEACRRSGYTERFSGRNNPNYKGEVSACAHCGIPMIGYKHNRKNGAGKKVRFCSVKCAGAARRGELNPFYGRRHTAETRAHLSAVWDKEKHALLPHVPTLEERAAIAAAARRRWASLPSEERERRKRQLMCETAKQASNRTTRIEAWLYAALSSMCIPFERQAVVGNRFIADALVYGCVVVEVMGDYWHGNPHLYDPGDKRQRRQRGRDTYRRRVLRRLGYTVIWLWESEIRSAPDNAKTLLSRIRE